MEIVKALLKKGEWLLDALKRIGHSMIPSNCILDKTLTGLGATHSEIYSKRSSIIIEPNVPVILGKLDENENLEAVYAKFISFLLPRVDTPSPAVAPINTLGPSAPMDNPIKTANKLAENIAVKSRYHLK